MVTQALLWSFLLSASSLPVSRFAQAGLSSSSGAASAATVSNVDPSTTAGTAGPAQLASTGLDLTMPIVLAVCVLLIGTTLVGWAILRPPHHPTR